MSLEIKLLNPDTTFVIENTELSDQLGLYRLMGVLARELSE
jgi:hypothetical protein